LRLTNRRWMTFKNQRRQRQRAAKRRWRLQ
jgi:hypothetical protein